MLIDWFTVGAQVLNFLVLLWLMKRFLYGPILNAIDARGKHVADELKNADTVKKEATQEHDEFKSKNAKFDADRSGLLAKAVAEADQKHAELIADAKKEVTLLREKNQQSLLNDQTNSWKRVQRRAQDEVFSIARKALQELAGVKLEGQIISVLARKIQGLSSDEKKGFVDAVVQKKEPVMIRSSYEITDEQKKQIAEVLSETFGKTETVQYKIDPDLIAGIELSAGGFKTAWSISDYLASMSKTLDTSVNRQLSPSEVK